ncbi:MAG TPA: hypothetical protein VIX37_21915 [Candidatus Sulfotelmatobacter sp.]
MDHIHFAIYGMRAASKFRFPNRQKYSCADSSGSELDMQAEGWRKHGAAVAVVAGVGNVLRVERREDAAPELQSAVAFFNILRELYT